MVTEKGEVGGGGGGGLCVAALSLFLPYIGEYEEMVGCDDPFRKVKRAAVVEKLSPLSEEATTGTSIGRANAGRAQRI